MNYSEFNEITSFDTNENDTITNHVWGDQLIKKQEEERKERERLRFEEHTMKLEKLRQEKIKKQKLEKELKEKEYIEINKTDLWEPGNDYPNIFVPLSIKRIPALDKVNFLELWLYRDGKYDVLSSLVGARDLKPFTIEEYYKEFCTKKEENGEVKYLFTKNIEYTSSGLVKLSL